MAEGVRLPAGLRDHLPRPAARRRAIAERLLAEFAGWGFERIITPVFEVAEVLERGLGGDARSATIRFVEPASGEVVALRPDITPQVARLAATRMQDIGGPLRLCYEGAVTRLAAGPGGQRELLQAGVEIIGAGSPEGDAEAISLAAAVLAATGIPEVRLEVSHVAIARGALAAVPDKAPRAELYRALARKDRASAARLAKGLPPEVSEVLAALPSLYGEPAEVLERARALPLQDEAKGALDSVDTVLSMTREAVEEELHSTITLDLGEVRGFEYYTGIRFFGYAAGAGDAVLRGGRYDELVGRYGGSARATGFAASVEAIAEAQAACGLPLPSAPGGVLVAASAKRRREASRIAAALRSGGQRAAVDLGSLREDEGLLAYARSVGFDRVLVLDGGAARLAGGGELDAGAISAAAAGQAGELLALIQRRM